MKIRLKDTNVETLTSKTEEAERRTPRRMLCGDVVSQLGKDI